MDNTTNSLSELSHPDRAVQALFTDSWNSRLNGYGAKDSNGTESNGGTDKHVQALPTVTIDTSHQGEQSNDKPNDQSEIFSHFQRVDTDNGREFSTGDRIEQTGEHQRWQYKNQEITIHKDGKIDMHLEGATTVHTYKGADKANPERVTTEIIDSEGGVVEFDDRGINEIKRNDKRILVKPAFVTGLNPSYSGGGLDAYELNLADPAKTIEIRYEYAPSPCDPHDRYGNTPYRNHPYDRYNDRRFNYNPYGYGEQIDREYAAQINAKDPAAEKDAEKRSGLEMTQALFKKDFAKVAKVVARYKDYPALLQTVCNEASTHLRDHSTYELRVDNETDQHRATVSVWTDRTQKPCAPNHSFRTDSATEINLTR